MSIQDDACSIKELIGLIYYACEFDNLKTVIELRNDLYYEMSVFKEKYNITMGNYAELLIQLVTNNHNYSSTISEVLSEALDVLETVPIFVRDKMKSVK